MNKLEFSNGLKEAPDYFKIIEQSNHPLALASKDILKTSKSDLEHNQKLLELGLIVNIGSRAANMIPHNNYENLDISLNHNLKFPNSMMHGRTVQPNNLYQLKSGPRIGAYLGANIVDFDKYNSGSNQKYIATEAPYDASDYFRMVIDKQARILVSLTNDNDNDNAASGPVESIRGEGLTVNIHHLAKNHSIKVDGYNIECFDEKIIEDDTRKIGVIKYLKILKDKNEYLIHHIIYNVWPDGKLLESSNKLLTLLNLIANSENELQSNNSNMIIVNCAYGYGRTAILILMDQIRHMVKSSGKKYNQIDLMPMIYSIQNEIAYGALTGTGDRTKEITILENQIKEMINHDFKIK